MAVLLQQTSGSIIPEYAATSISFNRQIQNISGVLVPIYTANISYERKDYLVNQSNEKIGVISTESMGIPAGQDERRGNIYLSAEQLGVLFSQTPATDKVIGEIIADMADSLIQADLTVRGII